MVREQVVERLTRLTQASAVHVRVRSALNPLLWLNAIMTPICLLFALRFDGIARALLLGAALLPIALSCAGYVYFMIKNPDRLQSEDYQLRKQALELIHEKGARIAISPTSLEAIANPMLQAGRAEVEREQG